MKLIIIITLICAILILTTVYSAAKEVKSSFTDEEWKIIKPRIKKKYSWYIFVIIICFPFINWLMCLFVGIGYRQGINELIEDYRELLKTE